MNYFITIIISLLGMFFALTRPRWGIVLILGMLYFPIFSLFNLGSIAISVSTLPVLVLFGNAFWKWGHNSREIKIAAWQWLVMIGMAISILLSTVVSQSPSQAWSIFPNQILYILIIFSTLVLCRSRDDFVAISKAILIFVFVDGIWPGLPPIQQFFGERMLSVNGLVFKYYIAFAVSAVLILQPISGFSRTWRFFALVVSVLVIFRAVVFESRAAWLALITIMILGFVRLPRRHLLLGIVTFTIYIGATLFANIMLTSTSETQQMVSALRSNNTELATSGDRIRLIAVRFGWKMFQERPVLGWGPGVFSGLMRNYAVGPARYILGQAFNSWLLLMVENGVVGLITFLLAFIIPFVIVWMNFNKIPVDVRYLAFAFVLGVLGMGIHLAFIDLLYTSQVWFHVGVAMAGARTVVAEMDEKVSIPLSFRGTSGSNIVIKRH